MKRIFLDTNFLLDLLVRADDFRQNARSVLELCLRCDVKLYISFLSVANFAYIVRKDDIHHVRNHIKRICGLFSVIDNTQRQLLNALDIDTMDYEDALQYETAISQSCDCIITRNKKDFKFSEIRVLTPEEFLTEGSR